MHKTRFARQFYCCEELTSVQMSYAANLCDRLLKNSTSHAHAHTHTVFFYICSSVHRNSRLKKPNKMQQYADIYLLLNYSTRFGRPSRPSSGVHKTVVAAFFKRDVVTFEGDVVTFEEACFPDSSNFVLYSMICTRGCNYSFMYSW